MDMKEVEEALDRADREISAVRDPAVKQALLALHDAITALSGLQEPELPDLPEPSDGG